MIFLRIRNSTTTTTLHPPPVLQSFPLDIFHPDRSPVGLFLPRTRKREREPKNYYLSTILIHVVINPYSSRLIHRILITIHTTYYTFHSHHFTFPPLHSIQTNDTTHNACTILRRHHFPSITPYSHFTIIPPPSGHPNPIPNFSPTGSTTHPQHHSLSHLFPTADFLGVSSPPQVAVFHHRLLSGLWFGLRD